MPFYTNIPTPSDRMGALWTLAGIQDAIILEFGPSGHTSFAGEGFLHLNMTPCARILSTHLDVTDITFGKADRLINAVKEIDRRYAPEMVFILSSSLAGVTGVDTEGICRDLQRQTASDLLVVDDGGFRGDYAWGIRQAMTRLCAGIVKAPDRRSAHKATYNIIGSQADCFNYRADVIEIQRLLKKYFNLKCHAVFTSNVSLQEIRQASLASFNVIMRSEGLPAAQILKEKWHQDFLPGTAYGRKNTLAFLQQVSELTGILIDRKELLPALEACERAEALVRSLDTHCPSKNRLLVSGNQDAVMGMCTMLRELGFKRTAGIINHEIRGDTLETRECQEQVKSNLSERQRDDFLAEWNPNIVLGDGILTGMFSARPDVFYCQVSNPNIGHISLLDRAPFVGFNGVIHLCELLSNGMVNHR